MGAQLSRVVKFQPTLKLTAYADGDQVGVVKNLDFALDINNDSASVLSLTVIDKAAQKADLDILLFNEAPVVASTDGTPLDITGAEMSSKFLGRVKVAAADYTDLAAVSVATITGIGLLLEAITTAKTLHAIVQCRATPTYVAADDLTIKIGLLQD